MSNKQFFNNLSSTYADVRKLDVKKINLKGKNILEYIKENKTVILDERGTKADDELDIWNSYVTTDENGNVIINRDAKPFEHAHDTISSIQSTTIKSAVKVIDNEVLGANDEHIMYWQTDGLTNGESIFGNANIVTFDSDMPSLTIANYMFTYTPSLTSFNGDLSSLVEGNDMFFVSELTSFTSDLSSLQKGNNMFSECYNLTDFKCKNLDSLTHGSGMFAYTNITSFEMNLSSLVEGNDMFTNCENLSSFNGDLSSLVKGNDMFFYCPNLSSFNGDLSSLVKGNEMFSGCSLLTSFTSPIPSLSSANNMFNSCKLDAQSVANIIHFIPQRDAKPTITTDNGNILIGIGIPNTDEAKQAFAEEYYRDDWDELNQEFDDKNWAVQWQFNGEATTFDLRSPRPSTAVYAKLEEVIIPTDENERKPHYKYTSQDGTKFYNIHWYHSSNTNNEGYQQFNSLEEAIGAYGVIPKN
jgi:hypothetical protein